VREKRSVTQKLDESKKILLAKEDRLELYRAPDSSLLGGFEAQIAVADGGAQRLTASCLPFVTFTPCHTTSRLPM